ncbi:RdgB/HAM1 family non-canonical purine NTP pyrophosphatase [Gammaproteobacteria bacterium]|nr:RdgB/HAM1 family non-canonical purine NTP pyrophosphatase [Gammaproteobacteria bacterium]
MKVKTLVLASSNNHKAKEVGMILGRNYQIKTQEEFSVPFVPETGKTFAENAYIKANQLAKNISLPVIADDSGLEVLSINNQPGIYSARYAYIGATDEENINKLLGALKDNPASERKAKFICSLVLIEDYDKQNIIYFNGEWRGEIANKKIGNNGFGYDPIFFIPSLRKTAAELATEIKNKVSHRAIAINKLKNFLESQ